jgi:hypothetical protein
MWLPDRRAPLQEPGSPAVAGSLDVHRPAKLFVHNRRPLRFGPWRPCMPAPTPITWSPSNHQTHRTAEHELCQQHSPATITDQACRTQRAVGRQYILSVCARARVVSMWASVIRLIRLPPYNFLKHSLSAAVSAFPRRQHWAAPRASRPHECSSACFCPSPRSWQPPAPCAAVLACCPVSCLQPDQ